MDMERANALCARMKQVSRFWQRICLDLQLRFDQPAAPRIRRGVMNSAKERQPVRGKEPLGAYGLLIGQTQADQVNLDRVSTIDVAQPTGKAGRLQFCSVPVMRSWPAGAQLPSGRDANT